VYDVLKLLHVLAVVAFLGNIATGLFWKHHADRTRDARIAAHTLDGIIRSDRLFTLPGVVVIVVSGFGAAGTAGYPVLGTPWILWPIVLFTASGVAYAARVAPLQASLRALARGDAAGAPLDWERYRALSVRWERWGLFALLTPLAALVLMVLKPGG
jgi:uncharacterized membrane protein